MMDRVSTPLMAADNRCPAKILEIPENITCMEATVKSDKQDKIFEPDYQIFTGETAILTCRVEGNPVPTFKWMKGTKELVAGGRFRHLTCTKDNSITLLMSKARSQDDGPYMVIVENELGSDTAAIKLYVTDPSGLDFRTVLKHREYEAWGADGKLEDPNLKKTEEERRSSLLPDRKKDHWEKELKDMSLQQGVDKVARLTCVFCKPNAKIRWYKLRTELFTGMKFKIINEKEVCTLIINALDQDDSGKYTCEANGVPTTCQLTVDEPPMKYEFEKPLSATSDLTRTREGTLDCKANNARAPVVWYRDGLEIDIDNKKYEEQRINRRRKLLIKNCVVEDEGIYKCTTKDDNTMCQLIVEAANKFLEKLKDMTGIEKEEITLQCATKDTRALVSWFKNGQRITPMVGSKYETKSRSGTHQLLIRKLELTDQDTYEIETGGLKGSCQLTVLEAERKPVINWKQKKVEAEVAKPLILKIPYSIKGTPQIVLNRNGQPIDINDPKEGIQIVVYPDYVEIQFDSCKKTDTGKYEMQMINSAGTSTAPFEMEVRDRPSPPEGPLEILDLTAENCRLKWRPPKDDGGMPVRGYIVEMKEAGGDWKKIGESKTLEFKVGNLKENGRYQFRVVAFNSVGKSDPLTGENIIAKNPARDVKFFCNVTFVLLKFSSHFPPIEKPSLDKNALKNLRVHVGEKIKYDNIKTGGEPEPDVFWFVNDKPIDNAERSDCGRYTITLRNSSGEDSATAMVVVVGRPSAPGAPLTVKEVMGEGCTLEWEAPDDDGGEPIQEYIIEAQEERGKFVEVGRIGGDRTTYKVRGLKNKTDYKFRVRAKNKEGESDNLVTDTPTTIRDPWGECRSRRPFSLFV
uniref:Uncharacterized protein n=1 Tax=Romanomermis culicivorax TaxID=13658 RepID=A0A915JLD4_ROMCU